MTSQLNGCLSFLLSFFLKSIVACRLCVIYMREDIMIPMAYMDYTDLPVCCSRKAFKLNHSLTTFVIVILYAIISCYYAVYLCMHPVNARWRYISPIVWVHTQNGPCLYTDLWEAFIGCVSMFRYVECTYIHVCMCICMCVSMYDNIVI